MAAATEGTGVVVEGQVISFHGGLSDQLKNDVSNSVLFAQLAASKKWDRQTQTDSWLYDFRSTLEKLGWIVSSFSLQSVDLSSKAGTVNELILDVLKANFGVDEMALTQRVLDSLKSPKNQESMLELRTQAWKDGKVVLAVGHCKEEDGNAVYQIGHYTYTAAASDDFLFSDYAGDKTQFAADAQTMILNSDVYSRVRDAVKEKLIGQTSEKMELDILT